MVPPLIPMIPLSPIPMVLRCLPLPLLHAFLFLCCMPCCQGAGLDPFGFRFRTPRPVDDVGDLSFSDFVLSAGSGRHSEGQHALRMGRNGKPVLVNRGYDYTRWAFFGCYGSLTRLAFPCFSRAGGPTPHHVLVRREHAVSDLRVQTTDISPLPLQQYGPSPFLRDS